ncbi:tannase/feruloyl esterase family alpha/beta hydrolase [Nonomuraea fuscirosea]|uniref:tannase/feruloyl esterase family alpha/beta hydrolase n=1 Tax=Nonomuraea fuscirosea TaxID=1291556 RepID=UPI00343553D4
MKRILTVLAVSVPLAAVAVYAPIGASAYTGSSASAPFTCSSIKVHAPAGTKVESVTPVSQAAGTVTVPGELGGSVPDVPAYCDVTVVLTHPGDGDHAKVRVWLPATGWNGRFQALGGSAYAAGDNGLGMAAAVKQGYAAATTDAGVGEARDTSWALNSRGQVNTALLENFADRSQHETAVVGKEVVDEVYGKAASYSYFNGCSTGGRQGYMAAQRHPDDFDGILATAPAINWDEFEVATLWPQVVMNEEHTYPTTCEFKAFNEAALKACDKLDGAKDGLIEAPERCTYDPRRLIGTKVECDDAEETITAADAAVVRKIWDGPRTSSGKKLWYGLPIGADFAYLADTDTDDNGNVKGAPFVVPAAWVSTFVKKQPSFDTSTLTYRQFAQVFMQSQAEYGEVIGTDDPDLSAFRKAGGKLLTWHGQADQLIPTQGTVDYRKRVEREMGGSNRVDDFYRLFLAPGTAHCGLTGKADGLGALTTWVEQGKAPETLTATLTNAYGQTLTRDLCRYPLVSRYNGHGDVAAAGSYRCAASRG